MLNDELKEYEMNYDYFDKGFFNDPLELNIKVGDASTSLVPSSDTSCNKIERGLFTLKNARKIYYMDDGAKLLLPWGIVMVFLSIMGGIFGTKLEGAAETIILIITLLMGLVTGFVGYLGFSSDAFSQLIMNKRDGLKEGQILFTFNYSGEIVPLIYTSVVWGFDKDKYYYCCEGKDGESCYSVDEIFHTPVDASNKLTEVEERRKEIFRNIMGDKKGIAFLESDIFKKYSQKLYAYKLDNPLNREMDSSVTFLMSKDSIMHFMEYINKGIAEERAEQRKENEKKAAEDRLINAIGKMI